MITSKNNTNTYGLTEKSQATVSGNHKVLNYKLNVSPEFYERWHATLKRLSTKYDGGGTTILLNSIETLLPQLEALAESIPAIVVTK